MTSHPTDEELELIQDVKDWKEAFLEMHTRVHELTGAPIQIKSITNHPEVNAIVARQMIYEVLETVEGL